MKIHYPTRSTCLVGLMQHTMHQRFIYIIGGVKIAQRYTSIFWQRRFSRPAQQATTITSLSLNPIVAYSPNAAGSLAIA